MSEIVDISTSMAAKQLNKFIIVDNYCK